MQHIEIEREELTERLELAVSRLEEIPQESRVPDAFRDFFAREAEFLLDMHRLMCSLREGAYREASIHELEELNRKLYKDILPENYGTCPGNPTYAVSQMGKGLGELLSFLYTELRGAVVFAYENKELSRICKG